MPSVNPVAFPLDYASTLKTVAITLATYPHTPSEPPLACYVTASCTSSTAARPQR